MGFDFGDGTKKLSVLSPIAFSFIIKHEFKIFEEELLE
jgi:hypothetical protein